MNFSVELQLMIFMTYMKPIECYTVTLNNNIVLTHAYAYTAQSDTHALACTHGPADIYTCTHTHTNTHTHTHTHTQTHIHTHTRMHTHKHTHKHKH